MRRLTALHGLEFAQDMFQHEDNNPEIKRAAAEILLASGQGTALPGVVHASLQAPRS